MKHDIRICILLLVATFAAAASWAAPRLIVPPEGVAFGEIAASRWTLPTVVLAGIVDGFNPCSFAIMISLAGILAIGGRKRKARILGVLVLSGFGAHLADIVGRAM